MQPAGAPGNGGRRALASLRAARRFDAMTTSNPGGRVAPAGLRPAALLAAAVLLALLGYFTARDWQDSALDYERLPPADCDLRAGPCQATVAGGEIVFEIRPRSLPLMQPLALAVEARGLAAERVEVVIRGLDMDMGSNRTILQSGDHGIWRGETILPLCSRRRMSWEAAVRVAGPRHFEIPFPFTTSRP
jgi:hypothetical protein